MDGGKIEQHKWNNKKKKNSIKGEKIQKGYKSFFKIRI
jgi:hypothetical protein